MDDFKAFFLDILRLYLFRTIKLILNNVSKNVIDKGDITLPFEAAFGLGYTANAITNFSIETQIQNWSDFKNEFDQSSELNTKDRFRIGFGGQYHPYRTNSSYFLSNFKYSAGISYDTGHLKISMFA